MPDLFTNSSSAFFTPPQNLVLDSVVTAAWINAQVIADTVH